MDIIEELNIPPLPKPKEPTYKYGSVTYMVLAFAHVYDKAMTVDDFQKVSNKFFKDKHAIKRALIVLEENKAMERLNEHYWRITRVGARQCVEMNRNNKNLASRGKA